MDINDAVDAIDKCLKDYASANADWSPTEIRVLPSSDDVDVIKVWLSFGDDVAEKDLPGLKQRAVAALGKALPAVADSFEIKVRADVM